MNLMNKLSRRQFLGKSALAAGTAMIASQLPVMGNTGTFSGTVKLPVGFQVWTIKDQLIHDFAGTLKKMAALGYKTVEMCSPPGYESSGFGPLMSIKAADMRRIVEDSGLHLESTHYGMNELVNNLDERIAFALESGQKQMILSSFGLPENATLSDWMKAADKLNEAGRKMKKAGIQAGYHNHHMEFEKLEGQLIYDSLLKQFDPSYVKMQFQVAVISVGYKAADYFKKFPGRFISAHLADWSPAEKKNVVLGKGIVDWKEFFASAGTAGLKNIFVEMDPETFKDSIVYLNSL
jgi:sugar phosphate isomerase/epimerase